MKEEKNKMAAIVHQHSSQHLRYMEREYRRSAPVIPIRDERKTRDRILQEQLRKYTLDRQRPKSHDDELLKLLMTLVFTGSSAVVMWLLFFM